MEMQTEGAETQLHSNRTSKPRPPVTAKKPKPVPPKKPVVAVKPSVQQINAQNGNLPSPSDSPTNTPTNPALDPSAPEGTITSAPEKVTKPKLPPPPLPKTSPRGAPSRPAPTAAKPAPQGADISKHVSKEPSPVSETAETVVKAADASPVLVRHQSKTPPPLPNAPPRGFVASKPSSKDSSPIRQSSPRPSKTPPPLPKTPPRGKPSSKTDSSLNTNSREGSPVSSSLRSGLVSKSGSEESVKAASQLCSSATEPPSESSEHSLSIDNSFGEREQIPELETERQDICVSSHQSTENIPGDLDCALASTEAAYILSANDTKAENVCDKESFEIDPPENNLQDSSKEDFKFSTLKSRFLNSEKPKAHVPIKPKPRKPEKAKSENTDKKGNDSDVASLKEQSEGLPISNGSNKVKTRSKWFVNEEEKDSNLGNSSSVQSVKQNKQKSELTVTYEKESDDVSVKFKNTHLANDSQENVIEHTGDVISSDLPDDETTVTCDSISSAISKDSKNDLSKKVLISEVTTSSIGSETSVVLNEDNNSGVSGAQPIPTPVPRRSAPIPKPRPVPRKRLSLNRLSGTDETFAAGSDISNVQALESSSVLSKSQSEESVFKNDGQLKIAPVKDVSADDVSVAVTSAKSEPCSEVQTPVEETVQSVEEYKQSDQPLKVKSLVKSRVVYNDKGEEKQYRVIDKSIVATSKCDKKMKEVTSKAEANVSPVHLNDANSENVFADDDKEKNTYELSSHEKSVSESRSLSKMDIESKSVDKTKESPKSNDSIEDLLGDKAILEPSSLLSEIEEILYRSFKNSTLSRSGSSPEKKVSPFLNTKLVRSERSRSVDTNPESVPIRPPRPKKEQKKLRSQSQIVYDSCGSDTESLPDLYKGKEISTPGKPASDKSATLGPAKPHPPKPKRHKLLKVQRSQSDVSAMKSILDTTEVKPMAQRQHRRQISDAGPCYNEDSKSNSQNAGLVKPTSLRMSRPSRRAPDPPSIPPYKSATLSPTVDINYVVPLDARVKSLNASGPAKPRRSSDSEHMMTSYVGAKGTAGSVYSSINGDDASDSSDDDHDYHEIPDEITQTRLKTSLGASQKTTGNVVRPVPNSRSRPLRTPPQLPPRNGNASQSFETESISSIGQEVDSFVTNTISSMEDVSISSGFEADGGAGNKDVASPSGYRGFSKNMLYPVTSSPYTKDKASSEKNVNQEFNSSVSSGSDGYINQRPVSGSSYQYDSGSSSQIAEQLSSSDSEGDHEKSQCLKIAEEVMSSERVFVDVLVLLNVDFRRHISMATEAAGRPVIPSEVLNRILDYLPQLQNFNENLLTDLEERLNKWGEKNGIADIFVKKGPFLKLYSMYIRDFETMTATFDDALKKYPAFLAAVKEFEMSERCASLALKHYMLKPIQRIPQYRLLLQEYLKKLPDNSPEIKDMKTALAIVSEVAHHANENMRHSDYVQKMLEIQRSLIGQFEVIKPGRLFLKEGELMKLSRKEMQPRYFFLFNDVLLYTTPVATGYRLNNVLPLAGMKVSMSAQDEYKMEFSIISVQRSFTLNGNTLEERDDWVTALNAAIEENALKRNTFEAVRAGAQVLLDKDFVLGHKAPVWIPDARVTMCMLCTGEFTVTWRRHHCRACGRVVCGNCSECKAPLRYLKYKQSRVCNECYKTLKEEAEKEVDKAPEQDQQGSTADAEEGLSLHSLTNNIMERFTWIRRSGRVEKKSRPDRLKEVRANDEGALMSGYLQRMYKGKKWKKQWFVVKEKVLYTFKATQDAAAAESMVLLGYEVSRFSEYFEGIEPELLFQLSHSNTDPIVFRTDSATATEKWVQVMREAIVA